MKFSLNIKNVLIVIAIFTFIAPITAQNSNDALTMHDNKSVSKIPDSPQGGKKHTGKTQDSPKGGKKNTGKTQDSRKGGKKNNSRPHPQAEISKSTANPKGEQNHAALRTEVVVDSLRINCANMTAIELRDKAEAEQNDSVALILYTWSYNKDWSKAETCNGLAFTYNKLNRFAEALAYCDRAIQIRPKYSNAFHNRGWAYFNLGEYDKAINDATEAIRLNPSNWKAYCYRGKYLYKVNKYTDACNDFFKSLEESKKVYISPEDKHHIKDIKALLEQCPNNP